MNTPLLWNVRVYYSPKTDWGQYFKTVKAESAEQALALIKDELGPYPMYEVVGLVETK